VLRPTTEGGSTMQDRRWIIVAAFTNAVAITAASVLLWALLTERIVRP
jgi:hypothetical protein